MNITSQNLISNRPSLKAVSTEKPQAKNEAVTFGDGYDEGSVTWGDVGKGLVGAVATAAIEGVGNTVSSIPQSIELALETEVALVKNKTIGPWLKAGVGILTAAAAVPLAVAATAIGSVGYGMFRGFSEGVETGVGAAIKAGVEDVKGFNTEIAGGIREGIRDFGNEELDEGEEPFDVSPVRAGAGLLAGAVTTFQGAGQMGFTTLKNIPGAFRVANKAIAESDASTPLKVAGHVLSVPAAILAAPLGVVGGAIAGLGFGVYEGYREGISDGIKGVNDLNDSYSKAAKELISEGLEEGV